MKGQGVVSIMLLLVVFLGAGACARQYDLSRVGAPDDGKDAAPLSTSWLDLLGEKVFPYLDDGGDTQYSSAFDDEHFHAIPIGVPRRSVAEALGEPLIKAECGGPYSCWYFTKPGPKSKSYFLRIVVFDARGLVISKHESYYVG
jgi:hypothetical protein